MRKFLTLVACAATLATAACNTMMGAGEDVSAAGDAVAGAAADAKN